ncbi:MAG: 2-isopropylmalate synthase [Lactobacillales bacterium]|nr:2-isopropylmalate synthase [Lactobacillales bacterium]
MKTIKVFDTTLRDGEQSPRCSMTLEEKVEFARQLERLNVDVIEAGFAASSPKDLKAIEEISKNVTKPIITSLARLNKDDIDKAYESLRFAKKKRIHVFIATSKIHMENKLNMTEQQVLNKVKEMVKYAKSLCDDIEFSLEDATRTEKEFMVSVIKEAINSGATTINIPDTVGYITPTEYKEIIEYIKNNVPNIDTITLSTHCHNDLGLGVANTLEAIKNGVTQVECTVNGIGERAGNAALEEIVMALKIRNDYYNADTNIDIKEIINSSKLLVDITGSIVQRNKPIVGENAFKHEAGIHQHGVLKNKSTYEIINTDDLGINNDNIVIGIHSGKHAIINKMKELNLEEYLDNIDEIVIKIKEYLETNKTIDDDNIRKIIIGNVKVKRK